MAEPNSHDLYLAQRREEETRYKLNQQLDPVNWHIGGNNSGQAQNINALGPSNVYSPVYRPPFAANNGGGVGSVHHPSSFLGRLLIRSILIAAVIFVWLLLRGNLSLQHGMVVAPATREGKVLVYRASDLNVRALFDWSPLNLMWGVGDVRIDGTLWHAGIRCLSCNIVVQGDANYSIIATGGSLSLRGAAHSKIGAAHLFTSGPISNTVEMGKTVVNRGGVGSGNHIQIVDR